MSSASDGAKNPLVPNNGTVNNDDATNRSAYKPALTIYPHKIDFEKLAADRANKKNAENAQIATTAVQTVTNADNRSVKTVKEGNAVKAPVETENVSELKSDSKNKIDLPKPSAGKGKPADGKDRKKVKGKERAQKIENAKIVPGNEGSLPRMGSKDIAVPKKDKTLLKPGNLTKSDGNITEIQQNVSVRAEKVENTPEKVVAEIKPIDVNKIDSRAVASSAELNGKAKDKPVEPISIQKSANFAPFTIPEAKPIEFRSITPAPISGRRTKSASEPEVQHILLPLVEFSCYT